MPDLICDTSVIQYLHQLELLHIIPAWSERVFVPPAVVEEIEVGHQLSISLPVLGELDWLFIRRPQSERALPLVTNLGPGEAQVLMLALEMEEPVAVLDDGLTREIAVTLGLPFTGTLGIIGC